VIPLALARWLLWESAVLAASVRLAKWIGWDFKF